MRAFAITTLCVSQVVGQLDTSILPSVVLPTDGGHRLRASRDVNHDNERDRDAYRRAFGRLFDFATVDFNVSAERSTGQSTLGTREAVVTPDLTTHLFAEPNQDCTNICHIEDRRIEELTLLIAQLDEEYIATRDRVVEIGYHIQG